MVIDDYDHFTFESDFMDVYPKSVLLERHWERDNRWIIYEVRL